VRAIVGAPNIAKVVATTGGRITVVGLEEGSTNIKLYDDNQDIIGVIDVYVKKDTKGLVQDVTASESMDDTKKAEGVVVNGQVRPVKAERKRNSDVYQSKYSNGINPQNDIVSQQVMVQVRFVEVNRTALRALGVRWQGIRNNRYAGVIGTNATNGKSALGSAGFTPGQSLNPYGPVVPGAAAAGVVPNALGLVTQASPTANILVQLVNNSGFGLDAMISAMEEQSVARRLAEPNLVALSGQEAMFLAGGEFPVPVAQPGSMGGVPIITVQWKEYGVRLHFVPTVLNNDVISMRIEPEVSDLDYVNKIEVSGVVIPSIVSRRTRTTVELREGQVFAISGLIQTKDSRALDQVPWLGSVPVLGALFRSTEFQKDETELVALITPYLVKPSPPSASSAQMRTPFDNSMIANDLDTVVGGKLEIPRANPTYITPDGSEQTLVGSMSPGAPTISANPATERDNSFLGSLGRMFNGTNSTDPARNEQ
jgi:pilus assembly protein CpaC